MRSVFVLRDRDQSEKSGRKGGKRRTPACGGERESEARKEERGRREARRLHGARTGSAEALASVPETLCQSQVFFDDGILKLQGACKRPGHGTGCSP